MAIQIKLKNSVVQDSTPSTSDLPAVGEIALNANINSIGGFMRASDNSIVKIFGPGSLSTPTATTTVSGISELATNSETTTGTAANRVVTPAGLNAVTVAERTTSNNNYLAKAGGTLTGVVAATAGSNSAPAIHFGDSDSGIFGGTNTVSLSAGGTTRLTADTGVSVVGTLAVTGAITSTGDLTIAEKIIHSGDTNTFISFPANDIVAVDTTGNERLRVDGSGRLLIGISTPRSPASNTPRLQLEGTNNAESSFSITRNSANNAGPNFILNKTRGTSTGADTVVNNGDNLGNIQWAGNDGTDSDNIAAQIRAEVDGTPGANDMPGRLVFYTTNDGANTATERLRINSAGNVGIGTTPSFLLHLQNDSVSNTKCAIESTGTNSYPALRLINDARTYDIGIDGATDAIRIYDVTATTERLKIDSAGLATFTGSIATTGDITLTNTQPKIVFNDSNNNPDYQIENVQGVFKIRDNTNSADRLIVNTDGNVRIPLDNRQLQFGASQDLVIYHNGTNSFIENSTGSLYIRDTSGGDVRIQGKSGEDSIVCHDDGGVELYHNNVKKFETTSSGATISGGAVVNGHITLPDHTASQDGKLRLGTSSDLEIYHDGTNSILYNNTGQLALRGNEIRLTAKNTENYFVGTLDGAAELYYNNGKKLETNNLGIEIFGTTNSTLSAGSGTLILESTNNDVLVVSSDDFLVRVQTSETAIHAKGNGAVELYHNGTKKFETTSAGATLTGDLAVPSGNGIDFSATGDGSGTTSSELLDDYEEGTWTPTMKFGGGTTGITYGSIRGGSYTKIGRQVTLNFGIKLSSKGSSTGHAEIHGIPYSTGDLISGTTVENNGVCAFWDNVDPNLYAMFFHTNGDHIEIKVIHDTTDAVDKIVDATESLIFQNDTSFRGSVTYFV